jgi:RHS repeat-associated protein
VQKISASGTTTYIHDAKGELAMEVSTAAPTASGTEYLTGDTLGSTRLITDASGNPQRCLDYLPFGEEIPVGVNGRTGPCYETLGSGGLSPTGPEYPAGADIAAQKFTGKERDAETGLDYFGARYFSAAQGRFTSPDAPFVDQHTGDPQSWNLYAYVRNNPLRGIDRNGRSSLCTSGANCPKAISQGLLGNAESDAARDALNATLNAPSPPPPGLASEYYTPSPEKPMQIAPAELLGIGAALKGLLVGAAEDLLGAALSKIAGDTGIQATEEGLSTVASHLSRFGDVPENSAMMSRLTTAFENGKALTGADATFYQHELMESELVEAGMDPAAAHLETLSRQGIAYVPGYEVQIYDPSVIRQFPTSFSPAAQAAAGVQ